MGHQSSKKAELGIIDYSVSDNGIQNRNVIIRSRKEIVGEDEVSSSHSHISPSFGDLAREPLQPDPKEEAIACWEVGKVVLQVHDESHLMTQTLQRTSMQFLCIWNPVSFCVSKCFVAMNGLFSRFNMECLVSFVYAPNDGSLKKELWEYLANFKTSISKPWCLAGDFNETLFPSDRKRRSRISSAMISFKNCIDCCELIELPLNGKKFTWSRGNAASCIDRLFVSGDWLQSLPSSTLYGLSKNFSDHRPLHMLIDSMNWGPKPFQLMNCWWLISGFRKMIQDYWNSTLTICVKKPTTRCKKNKIISLDVDGTTLTKPSDVKIAVFDFFSKLYSRHDRPRASCRNLDFLKLKPTSLAALELPFSAKEIKAAVWECEGNKAPGPNSINFFFIRKAWNIIGGDIVRMIQNANKLKDFRPISLVRSLYKIISKLLATRMKQVLTEVISDHQTSFIKGRQIIDNVLIANEAIHFLKKRKGKGYLFKLDFHKTFDSVLWEYDNEVMVAMGFGSRWRGWIMQCISTAKMFMLVNGSLTRGCDLGLIEGIKIVQDGFSLSHLQFANDTLIFSSDSLLTSIEKKFRAFLWSGKEEGKKICNVRWSIISQPKNASGLGIGSLRDKNKALMFKWLWRFGSEESSMWKDVITSIYNTNYPTIILKHPIAGTGTTWSRIVNHCVTDSRLQDIVKHQSIILVGNGKRIKFWLDDWTTTGCLADQFPSLFWLSNNKEASLDKMGIWDSHAWFWLFNWTRPLRGRNYGFLDQINAILSTVHPDKDVEDRLVWKANSTESDVASLRASFDEHALVCSGFLCVSVASVLSTLVVKVTKAECGEAMAGLFVSDKKRKDGKILVLLQIWIEVEVCLASHPGVAPHMHL
ncbi:uncharacterized protein [Populus alba]|uniref:uncharacterized protein n=1 Tax=Populus alba TaxID=43335 RepID=UPI003CC77BFA